MNTWHVYLLKCSDETKYTGCTSNLPKRIKHHEQGYVKYTKTRLPIHIVTYITFKDKYKAFQFENI